MSERCGEPILEPRIFWKSDLDTGHRCVRVRGHDGRHRWSATWEALPPAEVEVAVARDEAAWSDDEDQPAPPG